MNFKEFECNYKELDEKRKWKYKKDKYAIIKKLGYKYITETVCKMYINDVPCNDIEEKLQIGKGGLTNILRYCKIPLRPRNYTKKKEKIKVNDEILKKYESEDEKELFEKLYIKYNSSRKVASLLGFSYATVLKRLKKYNIKINSVGGVSKTI